MIGPDDSMVAMTPFTALEVCICLSIPSDALQQCSHKTPESYSHLRVIPTDLLSALNPQHFDDVLDVSMWLDRVLMLSPANIVRVYALTSPITMVVMV